MYEILTYGKWKPSSDDFSKAILENALYGVGGIASQSVQGFSRLARTNRQAPAGDYILYYVGF